MPRGKLNFPRKRSCLVCSTSFETQKISKVTCSDECYVKLRRQRVRDSVRKHRYNVDSQTFEETLTAQHYRCKICGKKHDESSRAGRLQVDHDHTTLKFRGLLCHACNNGLGYFRDNPELLALAIRYLGN